MKPPAALFSLVLALIGSRAGAEEPWAAGPGRAIPLFIRKIASPEKETRTLVLSARIFLAFYQKAISPADGASCNFEPTCSLYAYQALRRRGPFLGALMTAERLLRDHEGSGYRIVRVGENLRLYDPVEANTLSGWPDWPWPSSWPPPPPRERRDRP